MMRNVALTAKATEEKVPLSDFVKAAVAVHGKSARNGDPRDHQGKVGQSGTLRNWTTKS
jgi:hypothetical protein